MDVTFRLGLAFAVSGGLWTALCQPPDTDLAAYERLLRAVAQLNEVAPSVPGPVTLNGQLSKMVPRTVQDAIGLSGEESQSLNAIAFDFEAKLKSFDASARALVFEARLQLVESDQSSAAKERLKSLDRERQDILLRHIQQLKTAFGGARFGVLDDLVQSRKQADSFFPLLSSRTN